MATSAIASAAAGTHATENCRCWLREFVSIVFDKLLVGEPDRELGREAGRETKFVIERLVSDLAPTQLGETLSTIVRML